jgi:hypothetical protein
MKQRYYFYLKNAYKDAHVEKIKQHRNKPIEVVAGTTNSSGTGPGIADGLHIDMQQTNDECF